MLENCRLRDQLLITAKKRRVTLKRNTSVLFIINGSFLLKKLKINLYIRSRTAIFYINQKNPKG